MCVQDASTMTFTTRRDRGARSRWNAPAALVRGLVVGTCFVSGCATTSTGPASSAPTLAGDASASGVSAAPSSAQGATSGGATPAEGASASQVSTAQEGRLKARSAPVGKPGPRGLWTLDLGNKRRALLYVPPTLPPEKPAPLVVVFHGRHGSAELGLGVLHDAADASGFILLAPEAASDTWDVIGKKDFGADLPYVDRALERVFARYPIDAQKIGAAGFSDGGSYALSVGLSNGALFSHVMAYSPGMLRVKSPDGTPLVFVSHGIDDKALPIASTSRLLVQTLRTNGYDVRFEEFRGGHSVPPELLKASVTWFFKTKKEAAAPAEPGLPPEAPPADTPAAPGPNPTGEAPVVPQS